MTPSTTVPAQPDESVLVEQAKAGDQQAFSELVSRYQRKIYRLAKNITRNDEDAEDVLQEAFLKAYEHLDKFRRPFQVLYLDRPHRRERSSDEAPETAGRSRGFAR